MTDIPYPKMDPEKWANAKLTIKEREEIKQYIQRGWSEVKVAEMYGISVHTVKYWSDDDFRAKDIIRAGERKKRKMENPAYAKKIIENRKVRIEKRKRDDPEYRAWMKVGWKGHYNYKGRTDEQKAKDKIYNSQYYQTHQEESLARCRRSARARDLTGFRMFWKHINRVYNLDNICHSKKEMKSTKYSKKTEPSITKSSSMTVKRSSTILQPIREAILIPIVALKQVLSK